MQNNKENKNRKLENYLVYGMVSGLFGGSILSTIGMMIGNSFIQIAGIGVGFSLGMTIGALLYYFKNGNS
ncbi:hypothetical protein ACWE42_17595 [Sutcliffiella cohnii]|uniref:Uncharacterized protein n=1 Tax=Sutcliffiella cohnii TaxID=33932 RepID=A0A223KP82_9BACI|nr:hypothetical protein [Sutcliffiella cohnii]AST91148.1 hypothetical protein BC6307_07575 [Sutcliffiella cohnii]